MKYYSLRQNCTPGVSYNTTLRTIIYIVCYASYISIYIARLSLTMASPELKATGLLSASQIGVLGSVFSVVYAIGRLCTGTLGDRVKPYIFISLGLAISGISNIFVGFFPPFAGIVFFWGLNAFAQSMLWGSVLCTVSAIYPVEVVQRQIAAMVTSVAVGNILGIILGMQILETYGLRWAFIIPGLLTLLFSTASLVTIRKVPASSSLLSKPPMKIRTIFADPEIRTVAVPAMFHGAIKDNITLWMTLFFVDRFSLRLDSSAKYILLIPVVGLAGRMLYRYLYGLCRHQEHTVSQWAFALCIPTSIVLCLNTSTPLSSMMGLGLMYAAVSIANTSFLSIYPTRFLIHGNIASVSGLMDFCTYLGAGISSILYGVLIENFGYEYMFLSWAMISVASIVILERIKKKIYTR